MNDALLYDTPSPALVMDFDLIVMAYDQFTRAMPGGAVFYAMKANAHPAVLQTVVDLGGGLEIASAPELELALRAGATGERIICSNPIKSPAFIRQMYEQGVYAMVVDSPDEVAKVATHAPGAQVYVRLAVDNTGSVLPLAGKFGVDAETALALLDMAHDRGLLPMGLSFHVGSQCLAPQNWATAIRACGELWARAAQRGHQLFFLDIGGGFPVGHYHTPTIPTIEAIGAVVNAAVARYMPSQPLVLALEPGRGLVGEAGRLVTTIMGRAQRGDETWLYLDAGVFNGLMETYEGFPPVVRVLGADSDNGYHEECRYTLAGPSCDSCDVIARGVVLPTVGTDDRLVFLDAGAYTNEYASNFNGFAIPEVVFVGEAVPALWIVAA